MLIENILKKTLLLGLAGVCVFSAVKLAGASTDLNGIPYYDLNDESDAAMLPCMSENQLRHVYGEEEYKYAAEKVSSYLNKVDDGYERIEYMEGENRIYIEEYSENYDFKIRKSIDLELPVYGGIYSNDKYRYVVCGQDNVEENNEKEVIRIIQYSKNWERIRSSGIYGANTTIPFRSGTVSFAEKGSYVYVRTSHQMYKAPDGRNHQACMTFIFNSETMEVTDKRYKVEADSMWGYVSHSFKQEVIADGNDIIAVDHGDAYPRAVRLAKFASLGSQYPLNWKDTENNSFADILNLRGETGKNQTDASVGGLAASDTSYLVAGDYLMKESDQYHSIWLSIASKNNIESNKLITLTDGTEFVTTPVIVKVNDNKFLVMWNTLDQDKAYNAEVSELQYLFVDGNGNKITEIMKDATGVALSDCRPVFVDGKAVWYTAVSNSPVFYELDVADYSIDRKCPCGGIFYRGVEDEDHWADIYYIDENGGRVTGLQEIGGNRYLFGSVNNLCTAPGLNDYEGDVYCIKSDYTIACNEFLKDGEGMLHYATEDGTPLKNASRINGNVKYFFDEDGYVEGRYKVKKVKSIITYDINADDEYDNLSPSDFTYKKKIKVKKGSSIYLSNASLHFTSSGTEGDCVWKEKQGFTRYQVKSDTTVKFTLRVNGKNKTYKAKIKVKK